MTAHINRFPPAYNATYVKATSYYSNSYYPWFGVDPSLSLIGSSSYTSWISSTNVLPQKFNVDFGIAVKINKLMIDNYHNSGGGTDYGVKTLRIYGTNSSTAFDNLDGFDTTDLTLLSEIVVAMHFASNSPDTQVFTISTSSTQYRYASIIVVDNHNASTPFYGFRNVTFYSAAESLFVIDIEDRFFNKVYLQSKVVYPKYNESRLFVVNVWDRIVKSVLAASSKNLLLATFDTVYVKVDTLSEFIRRPVYNYDETRFLNFNEGYIEGTVTVSGTVWPDVKVRLYYNIDGMLVNTIKSDSEGYFRFSNLEYNRNFYTVVAFKEGYNAIIYDRVIAAGTAPLIVLPPPPPPAQEEWTPDLITTATWLDYTDAATVLQDVNGIYQWTDKSGNAQHAVQSVDARKPSLDITGIIFDDSDEALRITSPYTSTQQIFVVLKSLDTTFVLFGSGTQPDYFLAGVSGDTTYPVFGGAGTPSIYYDGTAVSWTTRNQVYTNLYNKFSILGFTNVTLTGWSYLDLLYYDPSYTQYSLQGVLKELIVLPSASTAYDRVLIEGYLAWKHSLTGNLPANHSFKATAPLNCNSIYPTDYSATYVIATSVFSANYYPHFATNPSLSLIGALEGNVFIAGNGNLTLPQKFNIAYSTPFVPRRIYFENMHNSGATVENGVKTVNVYGTNSYAAFTNTEGSNTTDLTLLTTMSIPMHVTSNVSDPRFYTFFNSMTFQYIVCIITEYYTPAGWFGFRRIEVQAQVE